MVMCILFSPTTEAMLGTADVQWALGLLDKVAAEASRVALGETVTVVETDILVAVLKGSVLVMIDVREWYEKNHDLQSFP